MLATFYRNVGLNFQSLKARRKCTINNNLLEHSHKFNLKQQPEARVILNTCDVQNNMKV